MFDWLSQGETQDVESDNEEEHFTMNVRVGSITLNPRLEGVPVTLEKDVIQDDIKDDWNALEDIDVFACDGLERNRPITNCDEPDTDDVGQEIASGPVKTMGPTFMVVASPDKPPGAGFCEAELARNLAGRPVSPSKDVEEEQAEHASKDLQGLGEESAEAVSGDDEEDENGASAEE